MIAMELAEDSLRFDSFYSNPMWKDLADGYNSLPRKSSPISFRSMLSLLDSTLTEVGFVGRRSGGDQVSDARNRTNKSGVGEIRGEQVAGVVAGGGGWGSGD